jgi:hypothetical protein
VEGLVLRVGCGREGEGGDECSSAEHCSVLSASPNWPIQLVAPGVTCPRRSRLTNPEGARAAGGAEGRGAGARDVLHSSRVRVPTPSAASGLTGAAQRGTARGTIDHQRKALVWQAGATAGPRMRGARAGRTAPPHHDCGRRDRTDACSGCDGGLNQTSSDINYLAAAIRRGRTAEKSHGGEYAARSDAYAWLASDLKSERNALRCSQRNARRGRSSGSSLAPERPASAGPIAACGTPSPAAWRTPSPRGGGVASFLRPAHRGGLPEALAAVSLWGCLRTVFRNPEATPSVAERTAGSWVGRQGDGGMGP